MLFIPPRAHVCSSESPVSPVTYKSTPYRLEWTAEHEAVKQKAEETLNNDRLKKVLLCDWLQQHHQAFLEMLTEFQSIGDGALWT